MCTMECMVILMLTGPDQRQNLGQDHEIFFEITEITGAIYTCCPRSQFPSASVSGQGSGTLSTAE